MFNQTLKDCSSLDEILVKVKTIIKNYKICHLNKPIVYVAGRVTADGNRKILSNLRKLNVYTKRLKDEYGFVFSSADIFDQETYWKLNLANPIHEDDFYRFWREVISSGVTDLYMTPGWDSSTGASDEFDTAKRLGLKIHYFKK